jgi:predicted transposase YbfD/YdcC
MVVLHFGSVPDPREQHKIEHPFVTIITIALLASLCGLNHWDEIAAWAKHHAEWLGTFLPLADDGSTPSEHTFGRIFARIRHDKFRDAFMKWATALREALPDRHIAVDGKALRGAISKASESSCIYLVSAFATDNELVLGSVRVKDKSNEIPAIPELLALLDLDGALVTIDAAGTQVANAKQIIAQKGDYLLSLKGNQGTTHSEVAQYLLDADTMKHDHVEHREKVTEDVGHGREETRRVFAVPSGDALITSEKWAGLQSVVMVERTRVTATAASTECWFFLCSLPYTEIDRISDAIRRHWWIENKMHWRLDVQFREDESRIHAGQAAENMALLRRFAMNCHQQRTDLKLSLRKKAFQCLLSKDQLIRTLLAGNL